MQLIERRGLADAPGWMIDLALMGLLGIFFALISPFASDRYPLGNRLVYWVGLMPFGLIFAVSSETFVSWLSKGRLKGLAWLCVVAAVSAIPQFCVVYAFEIAIFANEAMLSPSISVRCRFIFQTYTSVFFIMFAIIPLRYVARSQYHKLFRDLSPGDGELEPRQEARIFQRLSGAMRHASLIALRAEDHYVRVYTNVGQELIFMRFRDAVAETSPLSGFQTHRSWWVNADMISDASYSRGSGEVKTQNGLSVPISRGFITKLREAGLFDKVPTQD